MGTPSNGIPECHMTDLYLAQNMGYARSKLVTENLCRIAVQSTGMCASVLRIGQIVGDRNFGVWNRSEGIPLMIIGGAKMKAMPTLQEQCSWLPVDDAAEIVSEISVPREEKKRNSK